MESWISEDWWWVPPVIVSAGWIAYRMRIRKEGTPLRYTLFPVLDPAEWARVWTPPAIILAAISFIIVFALLMWEVVKHL